MGGPPSRFQIFAGLPAGRNDLTGEPLSPLSTPLQIVDIRAVERFGTAKLPFVFG
jgi:hypothetical protein